MTVSLRATPTLTNSTTATLTLTIPSAAVTGDLLVMFVCSANTPTLPSGWTQVDLTNSNTTADLIAYRVCQVTDPSTTVAVTITSNTAAEGSIIALAGTSLALAAPESIHQAAGSAAQDVTAMVGTGMVVYFGAARTSSVTVSLSRGTTDATRAADTNIGAVIGHESFTASAAVPQTFTRSTGTAAGWFCCLPVVENPRTGGAVDVGSMIGSGTPASTRTSRAYLGFGTASADDAEAF